MAGRYRVAVLIEQGGYDFYAQIGDRSESPRVKNEVVFLRDEEARHKAFFQIDELLCPI